MSYISDFKSTAFALFGVNGGVTSNDASLATQVGQRFNSGDYREFVLVQNGTVAIPAGRLVQAPVNIGANHSNLTPTANAAIGATSIALTSGGTVLTVNQYQGGFAIINAGTGIGQTVRIAGNTAATASGTFTLTLEDPLSVAIVASSDSKVTLTLNPYGSQFGTALGTSGVVISPTSSTGASLGVTVYPIPATTATALSYGFIQCKGFVACLNDATTAVGLDLMPSTNTAGAVMTYVVATRNRVGTSTVAGVTTEARGINIQL